MLVGVGQAASVVEPDRVDGPLILSLDIGTSSIRVMLFDRLGRLVEGLTARRGYPIRSSREGASEVDPDILLDRVWECVDEILEKSGSLSDKIEGVSTCTFVTNILGVDEAGRAVTPLITYADTRAAGKAEELRAQLDEEAIRQRTGCPLHTSYLPARFRWLAESEPRMFDHVARWVSIGEFMACHLFGETAVSYSVASWSGLLNRKRLVWDERLLATLPVSEEELSPLTDVDTSWRGLRPPFADRWPALCDVGWFPAAGDGAAANIGSGCTSPERVALTMGTTSALRVVTEEEVEYVPQGLWCYRVDRRRSLPGGALSEGGNVFAWIRERLNLPDGTDLDVLLGAMQPDGHGLTVLPFLTGERSPGWAGEARATFHGLSQATTSLDILRAGMEAVAYRIALVFDRLQPLLPREYSVVASGGALLRSPTWVQIVADVLGRPVLVSQVVEASARGGALLALEALGVQNASRVAPGFVDEAVEPRDLAQARYREAMARQQALYRRLAVWDDEV